MTSREKLYEFVYRGQLAEEALDRAGRAQIGLLKQSEQEIASALSFELLDAEFVAAAQQMATVYVAITAFERSARQFVARILQDEFGESWWPQRISERIRKFADDRMAAEEATKWHGARGSSPLEYTELGHLIDIMGQNWDAFEPHIHRLEWARSIFRVLEHSRNVIMHSGTLDIEDVERVGINIRDWTKQVGS